MAPRQLSDLRGLARRFGYAHHVARDEPQRDPYLRDPNVKRAASLHIVFGAVLGAGLGWAIAGWFDLSIAVGIPVGAVVGWMLANVLLLQYGGRSTR